MTTPKPDATATREFEQLVTMHHRQLLAFSRALVGNETVAEDLVQDALCTAFQHRQRFDPSRPFVPWLRGVIRNKYREWARSQRPVPLDDQVIDVIEARHRQWEEAARHAASDPLEALRNCLRRLPEPFRAVVQLFYFEHRSGAEIAGQLGYTAASVRKRLERARHRLADCVKGDVS